MEFRISIGEPEDEFEEPWAEFCCWMIDNAVLSSLSSMFRSIDFVLVTCEDFVDLRLTIEIAPLGDESFPESYKESLFRSTTSLAADARFNSPVARNEKEKCH